MFYHYSQNNSGGSFDFNKKKGITHHVVIEADNAIQANQIAESIGLYFNGCDEGMDCDCCGDRWCEAYGYGDYCPKVYDHELDKIPNRNLTAWMQEGYEVALHLKDGTIKWYGANCLYTE